MLGFIAQIFTDAEDPTGFLNMAWPLIAGVIIPVIVARVTTEEAESKVKIGVSLSIAAVAAGLSGLTMDWTEPLTLSLVTTRVFAVFGVAELAYRRMDRGFLDRDLDAGAAAPRGLNEQDRFRPEKGLSRLPFGL